MADKIRVLIVDDSTLAREALRAILEDDPDIEVVGEAKDGTEGVKKTYELKPHVITMDLKMPMMNGIEAIEEIMENLPTPIIVVSGMDTKVIVSALTIGAMDFVSMSDRIDEIAKELVEKIKIASRVHPLRRIRCRPILKKETIGKKASTYKIVAIGISTGGPQALQVLLGCLPANFNASIVVVQHISSGFIGGLVEWLKSISHIDVRLAKTGDVLKSGTVYFAPDDYNMMIGATGIISLKEDTTKRMIHVPSIDELMRSVADSYGERSIGVLMTGMGSDGVEGMRAIKWAGGTTIAQDEATSVVFGMNKVAIERGYIDKVVALDRIAAELAELVK